MTVVRRKCAADRTGVDPLGLARDRRLRLPTLGWGADVIGISVKLNVICGVRAVPAAHHARRAVIAPMRAPNFPLADRFLSTDKIDRERKHGGLNP